MAPMASATLIWEASSKTTRSKSMAPGSRKRAAESGLVRKQGVSSLMMAP